MAEKKRRKRFDYAAAKAGATSDDRAIRVRTFIEYFADFGEFPSYFFDNEREIDSKLYETVQDLMRDPEITKDMLRAIDSLMERLPSVHEKMNER